MELLYLDQNYLSGIAKRKPSFRELEPVLRAAVERGAVAVPESHAHRLESAPRPDLRLLALLRELSRGLELPDEPDPAVEHRLARVIARDFPERTLSPGDLVDLRALASALPCCRLVTCDAFMADVVRRAAFDVRFHAALFTGRRRDVDRLRALLEELPGRRGLGA